jgi:multiple sugar transport system ATP-binding protein
MIGSDPEAPSLQVRVEPDRPIHVGEQLWLSLLPEKIHLFDNNSGQAIDPK